MLRQTAAVSSTWERTGIGLIAACERNREKAVEGTDQLTGQLNSVLGRCCIGGRDGETGRAEERQSKVEESIQERLKTQMWGRGGAGHVSASAGPGAAS